MLNDLIGRTIGRYQIVEHLGRGGMAEVFKGYQASLDRYVALKLMHSFLAEDPEFYGRFEREAKNIATLRHPNIIQIHDFDREGPTYYMVMEFIDGGTLKDRLNALAAKGETLPLSEAIRIIKDVGAALAYAHAAGMIHRDIKPANVLIDSKGRVILTDFGIAKMVSSAKFTASGSLLGTPAYMAPEQGLGQPGDHRADIYSLGVMLYQLATGELPYEADTPVAVILKHVNEPLPMPRSIKADIPVGLERIIAKAMAKDAPQRYQSVDDMLRDLNNLDKAGLIPAPEATMVVSVRPPTGSFPAVKKAATPQTDLVTADSTLAEPPPAVPAKPEPRSGFPLVPIIFGLVGILGFIVVLVGAVLAGPQILAAVQGPSPTPVVLITVLPGQTLPPDTSPEIIAAITQQAATAQAQAATISALQATDTASPTPDLTATYVACEFEAAVSAQQPQSGATLRLNQANPVTLEIENTGECAWADDTILTFVDGDTALPNNVEHFEVPAAEPGEAVSVDVFLMPVSAGQHSSNWQLQLADGRVVGEPFALDYVVASATVATARPTARPTTRATNTPFVSAPLSSVGANITSCAYEDTFYTCRVAIIINGGQPPWNVTIQGANGGEFTWDVGDSRIWFMQAPRCAADTILITVIDGDQNTISNSVFFDPAASPVFPGGTTCTVN